MWIHVVRLWERVATVWVRITWEILTKSSYSFKIFVYHLFILIYRLISSSFHHHIFTTGGIGATSRVSSISLIIIYSCHHVDWERGITVSCHLFNIYSWILIMYSSPFIINYFSNVLYCTFDIYIFSYRVLNYLIRSYRYVYRRTGPPRGAVRRPCGFHRFISRYVLYGSQRQNDVLWRDAAFIDFRVMAAHAQCVTLTIFGEKWTKKLLQSPWRSWNKITSSAGIEKPNMEKLDMI